VQVKKLCTRGLKEGERLLELGFEGGIRADLLRRGVLNF